MPRSTAPVACGWSADLCRAGHCCTLTSSPRQREASSAVSGRGPRSLRCEPDHARARLLGLGPPWPLSVSQRVQACLGVRTQSGYGVWLLAVLPPTVAGAGAGGQGLAPNQLAPTSVVFQLPFPLWGLHCCTQAPGMGAKGPPEAPGFCSILLATSVKIKEPLAPSSSCISPWPDPYWWGMGQAR